MVVAGVVVAVCAVLVSILAAYLSWRQTRATELQSRAALLTLERDSRNSQESGGPPAWLTVDDVPHRSLVDPGRRTRLTSLSLTNHGPASLAEVRFRDVRGSNGESGAGVVSVRTDDGQLSIRNLRKGESRPLALTVLEPEKWVYRPLFLEVEYVTDRDARSTGVIPFTIHSPHRPALDGDAVSGPSRRASPSARRTTTVTIAVVLLLVVVLVAYVALRR